MEFPGKSSWSQSPFPSPGHLHNPGVNPWCPTLQADALQFAPPGRPAVIQACAPTTNAEEAEVVWLYEDLKDTLELTPEKDVLFIIGNWNAKVDLL